MKVLISLTYFSPYSSGLSFYAHRLAAGLVLLGHEVCVLTSQYQKGLPLTEEMEGIRVVRVPVSVRLSKGVLMADLPNRAKKWIAWADVVNLHLPQFESALLAGLAKRQRKHVVVTYHCDLVMQGGALNKLAGFVTRKLSRYTLHRAKAIVQNTMDYAQNSPDLKTYLEKTMEICTPVTQNAMLLKDGNAFREEHQLAPDAVLLGLAGRVASEKGYEYLARALPSILKKYPKTVVVHAGKWQGVIGEEDYQKRLEGEIVPLGDRWRNLGFLDDESFSAFFRACDLFIFSSYNATESFGIVQVEALAQGTSIIATDLPGVRQPVLQTGLGRLVPPRDSEALADAILAELEMMRGEKQVPRTYLERFRQENVASEYEKLFKQVMNA